MWLLTQYKNLIGRMCGGADRAAGSLPKHGRGRCILVEVFAGAKISTFPLAAPGFSAIMHPINHLMWD